MTQCFAHDHGMEALWEKIERDITGPRKCSVIGTVDDENRAFAYTLGLTDQGRPELLLYGVVGEAAARVFNSIISDNIWPEPGKVIEGQLNNDYAMRPTWVSPAAVDHFMVQAVARQQRVDGPPPVALQLVYQDTHHRWPEDKGYETSVGYAQVLLEKWGLQ